MEGLTHVPQLHWEPTQDSVPTLLLHPGQLSLPSRSLLALAIHTRASLRKWEVQVGGGWCWCWCCSPITPASPLTPLLLLLLLLLPPPPPLLPLPPLLVPWEEESTAPPTPPPPAFLWARR